MNQPLSLILVLFMIMTSCHKDKYQEDCPGPPFGPKRQGYAYAKGTYEDLGNYAVFINDEIYDKSSGKWIPGNKLKTISMSKINERCIEKSDLVISNIDIRIKDTITIKYSSWGLSRDFETSSYHITDHDAGIETYHLLEGEGIRNWLLIESINSDTTEIKGRFQLSYVTAYEEYLNGERERWDDPNRPDTLHFTDGEFRAEVIDR